MSIVPRFLSQAACRAVVAQARALGLTIPNGAVFLQSDWRSDVRWARNRVSNVSDWRDNDLSVSDPEGISINQLDTASLRAMGELVRRDRYEPPTPAGAGLSPLVLPPTDQGYPQTYIWSQSTYAQTAEVREAIAAQLVTGAEHAGMLSAGYLSVTAGGLLYVEGEHVLFAPQTEAQCSMTVRDPQGTGSGWAGVSSYDWGRFDANQLAAIALDKCLRSRNPVKIEPGRYTLIMEPQATFDLMSVLMRGGLPQFLQLEDIETSVFPNPFRRSTKEIVYNRVGEQSGWYPTRIGEQVLDQRLSLVYDPLDPDLGMRPFMADGDPVEPVTWVDHGVLTSLAYDAKYARAKFRQPTGKPNTGAFRMEGGTDTLETMIATTQRGLLVTRFWDVGVLDQGSMLCNGLTRDGLWLIEHGTISHPVVNLRFTESPLFAFNNVEQVGVPVPVFSPGCPAVVPPVKVRDFSFTAVIDAI